MRPSNVPGQGSVKNNSGGAPLIDEMTSERRLPADRRSRTLRALMYGSFTPRRRGSRRDGEQSLAAVDWHHPQWLAVAMLTLLMCVADALLTLTLLQRGAYEANPFMEPLVNGSPLAFATIKFGLTAGGLVVLILLARVRLFRNVPVALVLYSVLVAYAVLIGYELWLLQALPDGVLSDGL
jgi:ABC-type amino acid transport system permease subunit